MNTRRYILRLLLISLLLAPQGLATGVALADSSPSSQPSATVSPEPSSSPSPSPSPSPSASSQPSSSSSPAPSASPSPASIASPAAPSDNNAQGRDGTKPKRGQETTGNPKSNDKATGSDPATGAGGCGGVKPNWIYNTTSQEWVAADKASFSCDKPTGYYLSPLYYYDKQSGWYEIIPATAPKPAGLLTGGKVVPSPLGDLVVGSPDYKMAQALGIIGPDGQPTSGGSATLSNTGAGSTNQAGITNSGQTWFDITNLVNVINTLQSKATTGDVAATANTQAGNLSSGTATVIANLVNLLASAWSWSNGNLAYFMQNLGGVNGLGNGDVLLQPTATSGGGGGLGGQATTANTGADSTNQAGVTNTNDLTVNAKNGGNIVNNVDVSAASGNVDASRNTGVGNLASGDANAQVNIINLINSYISSGNSFFGVLNIFDKFSGDILFPNGFLNGLVASNSSDPNAGLGAANTNTGAGSTNQAGVTNANNTTVNNTSAYGLNNNLQTGANSGTVSADANTTAGSLASGNATTQNGLFNLANTSIFGDNAVLVIVNVLGHWVGKIMTVPGGTSQSALLTGNGQVAANTNTGAGSTNQAGVSNTNNATLNQTNVGSITNNVKTSAASGNASADRNTGVGDVTTGNAKAGTSVANLVNTGLNIKHWFGVLVINVFGDWFGSVNDDTAAGNAPLTGGMGAGSSATPAHTTTGLAKGSVKGLSTAASTGGGSIGNTSAQQTSFAPQGSFAATTPNPIDDVVAVAAHSAAPLTAAATAPKNMNIIFIGSAIMLLIAGALISIERRLKRRS